jgi:UDP-2,4-diacetamido-2,4,6-trideoxy-beta-L-altropyranose hydrolase
MLEVAIRADGGPKIGMGHITRCLALAEELKYENCDITFITKNIETVTKKFTEDGFKFIALPDLQAEEEIIYMKEKTKVFDILITDSYDIDLKYLDQIKKTGMFLVTVDDLNLLESYPSDIVINGNIYAEDLNYKSTYGQTKFLLGAKYALLRKEFRNIPPKEIKDIPENILITMGGSDPNGFTLKILEIIKERRDLKIDVVIGPSFEDKLVNEINELVKKSGNILTYHNVNAEIMKELMIKADIAISAGGSTLYELAAAGVPTIVIIAADNQIRNVEYMTKAECILNLGFEIDKNMLIDNFNKLLYDSVKRREISSKGQKILDGNGTNICAYEIIQEKKFSEFLFKFKLALSKIDKKYFKISIFDSGNKKLKYRERVYCYEAYHQLRCKLYNSDFILFGEEDKRGNDDKTKKYDKIPDFIFHVPGEERNYIIIEVKSVLTREVDLEKDYDKIKTFLKKRKYKYGILLIFGYEIDNKNIINSIEKIKTKIIEDKIENVKLIWHKKPYDFPEIII